MKKQILFAIHYLELGGAEMSLLGLLESLDYNTMDVDLFLYSHRGELIRFIPPQVNLMPEIPEYAQIERPIKKVLKDGFFRIALARLKAKALFRRYAKRKHPKDGAAIFSFVASEVSSILPDINPQKEYDVAVSYLTPHDYVLDHINAKEKVAWIHTDYTRIDVNTELELPVWSKFNRIVSISSDVTRNFLQVFPSLADKIEVRPNMVSARFVQSRADEISPGAVRKEMPEAEGRINLLSVGRFCYPKNYDNVPDICRRIRNNGIDAYWYLIGYGGDKELIERMISESGMTNFVKILGKKENPYPYIKACDIYVQPSRFEGSPMTVLEANVLEKAIILTDFPTARSVAEGLRNCIIVPLDNEKCANAISENCKSL